MFEIKQGFSSTQPSVSRDDSKDFNSLLQEATQSDEKMESVGGNRTMTFKSTKGIKKTMDHRGKRSVKSLGMKRK